MSSAPCESPHPSTWHLFLDNHVLARATGFDRVIHHPRPLGVVIPADQPWETAGVAPAGPVPTFDGSTPSVAPHLFLRHQLPGLTLDDCEAIRANSVEHTVRFKNRAGLEPLRGRTICLPSGVLNADLYAFRL